MQRKIRIYNHVIRGKNKKLVLSCHILFKVDFYGLSCMIRVLVLNLKNYMKKTIISLFLGILIFGVLGFSFNAEAKTTKVKGYFKSSGTYVNSYYKTSPNKTKLDNYSTKGNYNPYTGKKGSVNPYKFKY